MRALALGVCLSAALLVAATDARRTMNQGRALFTGARPLVGRIRGQEADLPARVIVCAHCHAQAAPDASAPAAPALDRANLTRPRERRGGPPSAYDQGSFCRLLRTGVDPVYVLIDRIMPVYELSDAACAALWQYLTP